MRVFEEEDTVKKNGNEKTFCTNDGKGMSLSTKMGQPLKEALY